VKLVQTPLAGNVICIKVEGRLDAATVPTFEQAVQQLMLEGQVRLVVDLEAVHYISSSGLRALLTARRQSRSRGGDVFLCSLHPRVKEIFEMVGFMSVFGPYATAEEAAGAFSPPLPAA
jgi:anti-sigma B factor antagonist